MPDRTDPTPLTLTDLFPAFGLRVVSGDLELRGIADTDLPRLVEVARAGVHDADRMPFTMPWTDAPHDELPLRFAQYHWSTRAAWSPSGWTLNLGVWHRGVLIGVQGCGTSDYPLTRTAETGSWLGAEFQGQGVGTRMRRMMCALLFDHLDARWITSGYFSDNPASGAVSQRLGYRPNGVEHRERRPGELATLTHLLLTPEDFARAGVEIEVHGLGAFRASIGLDRP